MILELDRRHAWQRYRANLTVKRANQQLRGKKASHVLNLHSTSPGSKHTLSSLTFRGIEDSILHRSLQFILGQVN